MKYLLLAFALFNSSIALGQQLGPTVDAELELIESDVPHDEADRFCDIGILSSFNGSFERRSLAQSHCSGFDSFCIIRQFGNQFYESNYRRRVIFRGRGNNHRDARRNAFDLYFNFLDNGRFYRNRFGHQFIFSSGCSS